MNYILYTALVLSLLLNSLFIHIIIKAFKKKQKMAKHNRNNVR